MHHKPCDVYSFAMVVWETFTGTVPFAGMPENEIGIMHYDALCGQDPERPPWKTRRCRNGMQQIFKKSTFTRRF